LTPHSSDYNALKRRFTLIAALAFYITVGAWGGLAAPEKYFCCCRAARGAARQ